jgi:hypothetical protein
MGVVELRVIANPFNPGKGLSYRIKESFIASPKLADSPLPKNLLS